MLPSPTDCARSKIENAISQDRAFTGRRAKRAGFCVWIFAISQDRAFRGRRAKRAGFLCGWSGDSDSVRLGHCSLNVVRQLTIKKQSGENNSESNLFVFIISVRFSAVQDWD